MECKEIKGRHSAVPSLAGTHLKVWSDEFGKISDTVKITLALQNVKGKLAQSLNVSISDSTTWPQVHALLINYFNNAVPVDLKPVYQFDQSEKTKINSFKKGKERQRQRSKIKRSKRKRIKRVLFTSESQGQIKRRRKDQVKRQRSMDHLVMGSKLAECQLGSESKRSKRVKERQRKIILLNLWKSRTCLKSVLVE